MEVVLLQNVKGLGYTGDVVKVAIGHAKNFLIPKGIANIATPIEKAKAIEIQKNRVVQSEEMKENAEKVAKKLEKTTIIIKKKVSSGDKLFGGVAEADISEALKDQAKIELDKSHIHLTGGHIKTTGEHEVDVHLYEGKHVSVTVKVEGE